MLWSFIKKQNKMDQVIQLVCEQFKISYEGFWKERTREHCDARKLVQFIYHKKGGMRITEIAMIFDCHHTTVIHAIRQAENYIEVDPCFAKVYKTLMDQETTINPPVLARKYITVAELKAIVYQAYKAGLAKDEARKNRLISLYE